MILFQDVQKHGVDQKMNFTKGWMCPIYKKKDKTRIENYRPIILLNSDYKTFTKALLLQLIEPMKAMIHHDQAGFIPGRSIFDHIRLTRVVITYAETLEVNGAIIAVEQEKAYDKTQLPVEDPRSLQAPTILHKNNKIPFSECSDNSSNKR